MNGPLLLLQELVEAIVDCFTIFQLRDLVWNLHFVHLLPRQSGQPSKVFTILM